jgi:hypothetical protein
MVRDHIKAQEFFNRNEQLHQSNVNNSIPTLLSFSAYSNLGYKSTCDLTLDIPCIYFIDQKSENDIDVIMKFIGIIDLFF